MRFAATNTFVANTAMMHFAQGTLVVRSAWGHTRSRHNSRHFPYYATRSQAKKTKLACSLVLPSSPTLDSVVALRLRFRLRLSD